MNTHWEDRFALRTQSMESSIIRELLKLTQQPDLISFAGGLPAPDVFPVEEFQAACNKVLQDHGAQALQYSASEGYLPLRQMIARHSSRYGINITEKNVLITNGSQQALDLIGKVFVNPGDHVVVEEPTYLGALQAWNAYQVSYLSVPTDEEGMRSDMLEEALRGGPKFIYALTNFQNPSGITWSLERRKQVIELADHHGVPVIEDDPYGQLRYEGEHLPTLVALDAQYQSCDDCYTGNVIYLSTFSKTLAPGLRLGWVIAPEMVIGQLVQAKQGADLHTSTFNQMLAYEVARGGFLDQHVGHIRSVYGERRRVMLEAMAQHFPPDAHWTRPEGGLFLWVTLPEGVVNTSELLPVAIEQESVAFVPGAAFYADGTGTHAMRLNFSFSSAEQIEEGIRRLGSVLSRALDGALPMAESASH